MSTYLGYKSYDVDYWYCEACDEMYHPEMDGAYHEHCNLTDDSNNNEQENEHDELT